MIIKCVLEFGTLCYNVLVLIIVREDRPTEIDDDEQGDGLQRITTFSQRVYFSAVERAERSTLNQKRRLVSFEKNSTKIKAKAELAVSTFCRNLAIQYCPSFGPADGSIEFGYEEAPAAVARWLDDVGALAAAASDPFANCSGAAEREPIAPKAARTADPYSAFSWEARRSFPEFEWDGRRDRNGRITGRGDMLLIS